MTEKQTTSDVGTGIAERGLTLGDCPYEHIGCDELSDFENEGTVFWFMFLGFVSILSSAFIFLGFAEGLEHLRQLRSK